MDFSWQKEQLEYKKQIAHFAQQNLNGDIIERDMKGIFSKELWQKCAAFGIQGLAAPKTYGGQNENIDILSAMLAMEGFGYGCHDNGLAFALNAQMWTVQLPIVHFGTAGQKEKFLPKLVSGEWIGAHALTEPDIGSDVFNMKMTAEKTEGGYILNGQKRLVTLAPIADVALVFANAKPKMGKWGVTAFLVEKGMPGFSASPVRDKMGMRTVPFGELDFDNCFVPTENRLGKEGAGMSLSNNSLEYERCSILASQLGAMERQLETAVEYAKNREQFGQPIGKFQSVSNRIADMRLRIETARLLLYKVAWLKKTGQSAMMEAALLKLHLSESFIASSLDAIRTHGGNGYLTGFGVERDLRDAVGGVLYAGTSDIQRNIIARLLGL
ncbi:MAG TPA: acyl-CoA dehydrogenase [Bacteroidetes bacterium]|nr:acyl-CoA dehydrogenase [Bacteroidota bacterium]